MSCIFHDINYYRYVMDCKYERSPINVREPEAGDCRILYGSPGKTEGRLNFE